MEVNTQFNATDEISVTISEGDIRAIIQKILELSQNQQYDVRYDIYGDGKLNLLDILGIIKFWSLFLK